jgi:argininosuccinate lyase
MAVPCRLAGRPCALQVAYLYLTDLSRVQQLFEAVDTLPLGAAGAAASTAPDGPSKPS